MVRISSSQPAGSKGPTTGIFQCAMHPVDNVGKSLYVFDFSIFNLGWRDSRKSELKSTTEHLQRTWSLFSGSSQVSACEWVGRDVS